MSAFASLLRERLTHALTLALALTATGMLRIGQLVSGTDGAPYAAAALEQLAVWLFLSALIVAIIAFFESIDGPPASHWLLMQVITLAAASAIYAKHVGTAPLLTIQYHRLGLENEEGLQAYITWLGWAMSALLTWYYRSHAASLRAGAELRRAELDRQHAAQQVLESRLKILEAQVEPTHLIEALAHVQGQYERDPADAATSLDELIEDLRRRTLRSA
jgi:hypothetical protein